ncbi:hypothetical protein FBU30_009616 [Linnemannia zychae]|nr:hypothetical protein FBU30_009616 [Linnemannia zychae]
MSQQQPDIPATPASVTYIGCFKEQNNSPDLDGEPPLSITRAEACFTHCSIGTWSFAAIRNGTICTCGDSENRKYGSAPESVCSTKCPVDQSAFDDCGGPEANSVYYVGAMTPKLPWPTPSINPSIPTHPSVTPPSDNGDGDHVLGHRDLGMEDSDSHDSNDGDDISSGTKGNASHQRRKNEYQDLFEGFESSAMDEDHIFGSIHPLENQSIETAPNNANGPTSLHHHHKPSTKTSNTLSSSSSSSSSPPPQMTTIDQPEKSSLAARIGLKMGHLQVKVPTHQDGSVSTIVAANSGTQHSPVSPISPISPFSPASRSSSASSTTASAFTHSLSTIEYLDIDGDASTSPSSLFPERNPKSATPSFSLASAPVPGPASNIQEVKKGGSSRYQKKQHQSDMIKDLILQGDSILEDKELALMAQYQPHHCRQQQQQQYLLYQTGVPATPTATAERSAEPTEKSLTVPETTAPAAALIIPSPRDYLVPPPRILVHKAL